MDEITRCLEVLGLKPGASQAKTKKAYRELLMVWHPDRFDSSSTLHAKAGEKVRELNAAYEFLMEHGFQAGQPVIREQPPVETEVSSEGPGVERADVPEPSSGRTIRLWVVLGIFALAGIGYWVWFETMGNRASDWPANSGAPVSFRRSTATQAIERASSNPAQSSSPSASTETTPPTNVEPSAPSVALNPLIVGDLLYTMRPVGGCEVVTNSDGLGISGDGNFLTREEYRPPFAIRTSAKTDLTNIRLVFGRGVVILNWELNPAELRYHDPQTGGITGVVGQGRIPAEQWQDIEWEIQTNFGVIRVNGQERGRFNGNYGGLSDLVGFHTINGVHLGIRRFEVQPLAPANPAQSIDLRTGLVLYFPFDTDEKDRASDYSGFGNHGKVQGATFVPEGRVGGALLFQGGSKGGGRVLVPNSASLVSMQTSRQFTLCAWLKPSSFPEKYPVIICKGGNARPNDFGGFECLFNTTGDNDVGLLSGGCGTHTRGAKGRWLKSNLQQWFHLAVVVNARQGRVRFYVNGQRTGDETNFGQDWKSANFALPVPLFIGGPDPAGNQDRSWFDGLIDEVRVYSRALSTQEIRHLPGFRD